MKSSTERPEKREAQSSEAGTSKKSVTFNIAKLVAGSSEIGGQFTVLLLDDGAPYSGIGISELKMFSPYLRTKKSGKLYPLPDSISDRTHWQYGTGSHSS